MFHAAAAGANYPRPGMMPRDPTMGMHPAELLGRPYADMAAAHHEQLQRHLMVERDRLPPHASFVAHHEEYLRFVNWNFIAPKTCDDSRNQFYFMVLKSRYSNFICFDENPTTAVAVDFVK